MTTGPNQPTGFAVSDKSLRLVICEVSENLEWNMKLSRFDFQDIPRVIVILIQEFFHLNFLGDVAAILQ